MTKFAKIISVFLCLAMVFSVAGAMVISSFAADAPQFALKKVSETSDKIVVELNLTSGTFNSLDVVFNMSGVTCESIAQGNASGMDMLLSNPTATGGRSHISAISLNGVKKGTVATITLNKDKKATEYSFSVTVADCAVTDENNENKSVSPSVSGNSISGGSKPSSSSSSSSTTKSTTSTTKKTTTTTKKTTTTTTKKTTTTTTKVAPSSTVPTNTLPSTEVSSTSEVLTSVDDTTTDFSYEYDDNTYDYYTPEEDETEPAGSDEILDDEKDPKTIIIIAAVAVVLIAGAVVAFVVINKKKNAE